MVRVSQSNEGKFITWAFGVVPPLSQYEGSAQRQLKKTAQFDLSCDQPIALTTLRAAIDPMRMGYHATIGASGCDKRASYEVGCGHAGFVNGKHEVTCTSLASASAARR